MALPILAWVLLAGYRGINVGEDIFDALSILRATEGPKVHALLARTWMAGALLPILALVALAAAPRKRLEHVTPAAMLLGVTLVGFLPILLRTTVAAFPSGSPTYSFTWLSQRLVAAAVGAGVLALGVSFVRMATFRRGLLLGVGAACGLVCVMSVLTEVAAQLSLIQALAAAVLLPMCLALIPALEGARRSPSAGPAWVPWSVATLAPVAGAAMWGWPVAAGGGWGAGPIIAGVLLGVLLVASAARLAVELSRERETAIRDEHFPRMARWSRGGVWAREIGVVVVLALVVAGVLVVWMPGIMHIAPPLR